MKYTKEQIASAKERLACLEPGDTVNTILRHVSKSGMSRNIGVVVVKNSVPIDISWATAVVLDLPTSKNNDAVKIGGCGMDMGFEVVYSLGFTLWPDGTKKPHGTRNGEPDSDGGYALKQRWL